MRPISFTPSSVRTVSAKARYTTPLPSWTALTHNDTLAQAINSYDADNDGDIITRVANVGAQLLASQYLDVSNLEGPFNPWVVSEITLKSGSRPGIRNLTTYYQKANGEVWIGYVAAEGFTENTKVYEDTVHALAIAPVSETIFYAEYLDSTHVKRIFRYDTGTNTKWEWSGAIHGNALEIGGIDVETWYRKYGDGKTVEYIYFTEESGNRAMYLTFILSATGVWSDPKYVFPLDVLDDTSYYKLGLVSNINDLNLILTTKTKRKNGDALRTYHIGPLQWSTGREMILNIDNSTNNNPAKVFLSGSKLFYLYYGGWYWSEYAEYFGGSAGYPYYDNWTAISQIISAKYSSSGPVAQLDQLELPYSIAGLHSNQTLELTVTINGTDYVIGTYDIDMVGKSEHGAGKNQEIVGRSNASKRLTQWQADTSYDFWSQTKQNSGPEDRGEFVIISGQYIFEDNKICTDIYDLDTCTYPGARMYPTKLNVPGYVKMVSKACRDGSMRAKFNRLAGTYHAKYGVGLHFYQLNVVEIADYLVKDVTDVTKAEAEEIKANGIVAVYSDTEFAGAPGVGLYKIRNGVMTQLSSASLVIGDNEVHWLMITSHSGYFNVYYRKDADVAWTTALTYTYLDDDGLWISGVIADKVGQGFLYLENYTPHQDCYPFQSDTDYIPLKGSHSEFPASGDVIVEDERIGYSSKSSNVTKYGPYVYGGITTIEENTDIDGGWLPFANYRDTVAVRQQITAGNFYVRRIKVYVEKNNIPYDGLQVCVYTTPVNKKTPAGKMVASVTIPITDFPVTDTFYWVTADFPEHTLFRNGDWIMLYREENPTHPRNTEYYTTMENDGYTIPCELFDEDTDQWSQWSGGCIPFKIYGTPVSAGDYYGVQITGGPNVSNLVNSALVVVDGTGKNYSWKIVGYTYGSPASTVYISEDPEDILGADSYLAIAPTLLGLTRGENYAGLARQIETATITGTITTSGNAIISVRAMGMDGNPKEVLVPVVNGDSASDVGGKVRTALTNDADISDFFTVSGSGATVILTAKKVASNDTTMNIGSKDGTCIGLTATARSANTTKGVNSIASSHGEVVVSVYSEYQIELQRAQYYSTDMDMTVGDMAKEVCTKAGCVATSRLNELSENDISAGQYDFSLSKTVRNFIMRIKGDFSNYGIGVFATADPTGSPLLTYRVFYIKNNVLYYKTTTNLVNFTDVEEFSPVELIGHDSTNSEALFSFNDGAVSIWLDGLYIHTFVAYHVDWDTTDKYAGVFTMDASTITVEWEEADIRVDNFILDMGQSGSKLLDMMIGEKRIWYTDKADGTIEVFTSNTQIGNITLGVQSGEIETNDALATRVRAEGGEASEVIDEDVLELYGNIFRLINAREAYDENDAKRFANYALEDMVGRIKFTTYSGAADPRLEAFDEVILPTGGDAIVDSVSNMIAITMEEAIFDMNVRVRWRAKEIS